MSVSVTLTRKFENSEAKAQPKLKGISKSILQVPFKINFESKIPNLILKDLLKSNCKGKCKILCLRTFPNRSLPYNSKPKCKVCFKIKV